MLSECVAVLWWALGSISSITIAVEHLIFCKDFSALPILARFKQVPSGMTDLLLNYRTGILHSHMNTFVRHLYNFSHGIFHFISFNASR